MWDKRRSDTLPAAQPSQPDWSEARLVSAPPTSFRVTESPGTAIGSAISIVGDIYSEEDLFMDGEIRGTVEVKESRLTVGPNGKADSNVKAREVVILGQVRGDVEASQKIMIRKQGSLVGNIKTTGIVIDDEAYFKGSIDIVRKP